MNLEHPSTVISAGRIQLTTQYPDMFTARSAISDLQRAGVPPQDIHLVNRWPDPSWSSEHSGGFVVSAMLVGGVMVGVAGALLGLLIGSDPHAWLQYGALGIVFGSVASVVTVALGGPDIAEPQRDPSFEVSGGIVAVLIDEDDSNRRAIVETIMTGHLQGTKSPSRPPQQSPAPAASRLYRPAPGGRSTPSRQGA